MSFEPFRSWADVLAYVQRHGAIYYQAPLDWRPVLVRASAEDVVKIEPDPANADPFNADILHLDRFKRKVK